MDYKLIIGLEDTDDGTGQSQAIMETVSGKSLPETAMYLIWLRSGFTPICVSGGELADGYSGEYSFTDGMVIDRVN